MQLHCTLSLVEMSHFVSVVAQSNMYQLTKDYMTDAIYFCLFFFLLINLTIFYQGIFGCLLPSNSFLQYMTLQIIQPPIALLQQRVIAKRHMVHCRVVKSQPYLHSCYRRANKHNLFFPFSHLPSYLPILFSSLFCCPT